VRSWHEPSITAALAEMYGYVRQNRSVLRFQLGL
jgi:hypothetical protein